MLTDAGKALLAHARQLVSDTRGLADAGGEHRLGCGAGTDRGGRRHVSEPPADAELADPIRAFPELAGDRVHRGPGRCGAANARAERAPCILSATPIYPVDDFGSTELLANHRHGAGGRGHNRSGDSKGGLGISREVLEDQVQLVLTDRAPRSPRGFPAASSAGASGASPDLRTRLEYLLAGVGLVATCRCTW